jgi:cyclophilin family peptidyl-prolyl cis-trans isomerase/HEAT repeat protein
MTRFRCHCTAALLFLFPAVASAQLATRVSVLQAEDRRAQTAQDLATIRAGARSGDAQTARISLRALGRLERPALIPDILAGLRHPLPEVRAEAANAVAQAAQGLTHGGAASVPLASVQGSLITRLGVEADPDVRAALCEAIGRLPYTAAADVERAESTLVQFAGRATTNTDRLGVARGLEALVRVQRDVRRPGQPAIDELKVLALNSAARPEEALLRDARVRRLALESLIALEAADAATVTSASSDPDAQVRRLAVKAATIDGTEAVVTRGLTDPAPMVRIEALRTLRNRGAKDACGSALAAASDPDTNVAIVAIDQLGACGHADDAVSYLVHAVADPADAEAPRNWHRAAHALVALATAAPDRAADALGPCARSRVWQLRVYAARASALLGARATLERLAVDADDNVVEAAIGALSSTVGHAADDIYASALAREAFQVVRAAALALDRTPQPDAVLPALKFALQRAEGDARPGAVDARAALRATLASVGSPAHAPRPGTQPAAPINAADLRRLAAPRARFTIHDVGVFDVALFTIEAPATVLRFAQLASSGYYNGLTFHRVVPNSVVQGGSPGANEYSSDAPIMRDEVGQWPHVRGALGISTRGRDTGDGQIFIDLVDNPRYDHTYTVFAQVLNGMDVVDRILEGDVIDTVEILP